MNINSGTYTGINLFNSKSTAAEASTKNVINGGTFNATGYVFGLERRQMTEITGGIFKATTANNVFYLFYINPAAGARVKYFLHAKGGTFTDNPAAAVRNHDMTTTYVLLPTSQYTSTPNGTTPETWTVTFSADN